MKKGDIIRVGGIPLEIMEIDNNNITLKNIQNGNVEKFELDIFNLMIK